ncbi:MAG TPA: hotdog fold thioesterase [Bacteroidia bacterium]|nr:hotdog fold thioesterase [Bacteroidia bacterium]
MSIWHNTPSLTQINALNEGTLGEYMNITFTEMGDNFIKASMPVDNRTRQPFGLLHGGASVALAETLGSVASWCCINRELFMGVGIEINANHIKAVMSGLVTGICTPINVSGKYHVWDIKIHNEQNELCCVSRFTCTVVAKSKFT